MKLNQRSYEQLVTEDLEWLAKQPRTLEREHVEVIVRSSVPGEYETKAELAARVARLEVALLDVSRFIPTDQTISINGDTNRLTVELVERKREEAARVFFPCAHVTSHRVDGSHIGCTACLKARVLALLGVWW